MTSKFGSSILILVPHPDDEVVGFAAAIGRAKAAGAKIVHEIADASYDGRGYSCRDLEGHLWSFGSYDPWAR